MAISYTYNLQETIEIRERLRGAVSGFVGTKLEGSSWYGLITAVHACLPKSVTVTTVSESLRYLVGSVLTDREFKALTWRMAGNLPRLRRNRWVTLWKGQFNDEWVPAQVVDVVLARKWQKLGHEIHFRVVGGLSCPCVIPHWWSFEQQRYFAYFQDDKGKGFGFSRNRGDTRPGYPFSDAKQFVQLRCQLLMTPDSCRDGPDFSQIGFNVSSRAWNMDVQHRRFRRLSKYECPMNYPNTWPCYRCMIGRDQCSQAVHPTTYVVKACGGCDTESAPFENDRAGLCVNCETKERLKQGE
jgi:hypothetical protein